MHICTSKRSSLSRHYEHLVMMDTNPTCLSWSCAPSLSPHWLSSVESFLVIEVSFLTAKWNSKPCFQTQLRIMVWWEETKSNLPWSLHSTNWTLIQELWRYDKDMTNCLWDPGFSPCFSFCYVNGMRNTVCIFATIRIATCFLKSQGFRRPHRQIICQLLI